MNLNKLCPARHTEYLSHVRNCADCGADLLLPRDYGKAQEKKKQLREKAVEDRVVVREGEVMSGNARTAGCLCLLLRKIRTLL